MFPFAKFPGVDPVLSPEMHSTGEVMGIGETFGEAYGKAMIAAGLKLPASGTAFISVNDNDKGQAVLLARRLARLGFELIATRGTAERLREVGLKIANVFKVNEGRPNIVDQIKQGEVALIINTPLGRASHYDEQAIRRAALQYNVPCVTTMTGAQALVEALESQQRLRRNRSARVAGLACGKCVGAVRWKRAKGLPLVALPTGVRKGLLP